MARGFKDNLERLVNGEDTTGKLSFNTVFGDKITVERNPDVEMSFQYNISTVDSSTTVTNGGTVTQANSQAVVSSGTNANGSAELTTIRSVKYRAGYEVFALFTVLFETGGVANTTQRIGIFNTNDGIYLGYNGTDFVVGRILDGTPIETVQGDFNGDPRFDTEIDLTKLNIIRITHGWLGTASITFQIVLSSGEWITIHTMNLAGTLTRPHTSNPTIPLALKITKTSADATDVIAKTASWVAGSHGVKTSVADRLFTVTIPVTTIQAETVLLNLQNITSFQSRTNRVTADIARVGISTDGVKSTLIKIYKNLTITSPTFVDIDSTNSVMQKDTAGTVTPADANLVWAYPMAKIDTLIDDTDTIDIFLSPGDTLTVTGQSSQNNDVQFSMRWREHF